jgi:hypothetical protein
MADEEMINSGDANSPGAYVSPWHNLTERTAIVIKFIYSSFIEGH